MANKPRINLSLIYQELQYINETVGQLKESLEGSHDSPGLKIRVDRLEQLVKHVRYLWAAVIAVVGLVLAYRH